MKRYAILAVMTSAIVGWTASSCMAQASLSQLGQQQGGSGAFQQTGQLTTTVSNASGTFVGADSSDVSNFRSLTNGVGGMGMNAMSGMGSMGMMGMGGMGGMGGFGGMGRGGMGRGGQANDPRSQLRIPMRIGFVRPTVDLGLVSIRVTVRLTKIPTLSEGNEVKVAVIEGGVAVVTGSVASERDRSLIERLLELEAGVDEVRNELVVTAGETTPN
jgi:hypothetical protein